MRKSIILLVALLSITMMGGASQKEENPDHGADLNDASVSLSIRLYDDPTGEEATAFPVGYQLKLTAWATGIPRGKKVVIDIFCDNRDIPIMSQTVVGDRDGNTKKVVCQPFGNDLSCDNHQFSAQVRPLGDR
jgi:hypothetical protein